MIYDINIDRDIKIWIFFNMLTVFVFVFLKAYI